MTRSFLLIAAALLGLSSVILGAAGDHMLEGLLTPDIQERFDVALRYHQLYSLVLLALGLYQAHEIRGRLFIASGLLFLTGLLIFSGTLYLSIFLALPALTYGTPVGGGMLMAGWLVLAIYGLCRAQRTNAGF